MDEDSLRSTIRVMKKKINQLTEILEDHGERWKEDPSVPFNPHPCLYFVRELHKDIEKDADDDAENMSQMVHHVADRVIKDTVDRVADKMRSRTTQSQAATTLVEIFFGGSGSEQRRKDIEVKLGKMFVWDQLRWIGEGSFEDVLEIYKHEVEKVALKYAAESIMRLVDTIMTDD